jgi:AI-2 transport system ATP-binding protein
VSRGASGVSVLDVWKGYAGVPVLKGVSLSLEHGQIHALLGGNGAGKSTLMRVIAGLTRADRGSVFIGGQELRPSSAKKAHMLGLYLVPQEAHVFASLTVYENIVIGVPGSKAALSARLEGFIREMGVSLDLDEIAGSLEIADRQIVEILRGLIRDASFLILDEPTSALTPHEANALFATMRRLVSSGMGIVFISHKLREVREICDVITILRDGVIVHSGQLSDITDDSIVAAMTDAISQRSRHRVSVADDQIMLRVEGLTGEGFQNATLSLMRGEILGIAGVVGAGRTELAETIVGIRQATGGACHLRGQKIESPSPKICADMGLIYMPEDRQSNGLFLEAPIAWNVSAAIMHRLPAIRTGAADTVRAEGFIRDLGIKCRHAAQHVLRLSGGNQQKVLMARCLAAQPEVLILDEPTRGVDVAARADIYNIIFSLAEAGKAIIVISSDFDEIVEVCDRVIVMAHGHLSGSLEGAEVTVRSIAQLAFSAEVAP